MAAFSNSRLIDFLKELNVDLTQFKDLNFDDIAEEKELQPFLIWLTSSFDADNAKPEMQQSLEVQDENLYNASYKKEILNDIRKIYETRISQNKKHLCKLRLAEEDLFQREKIAHDKFNAAKKALNDEVVGCKSELVEKEIEETYRLCLSAQPYLPELMSLCSLNDDIFEANQAIYEENIKSTEIELAKQEAKYSIQIDNLENVLEESESNVQQSIGRYYELAGLLGTITEQSVKYNVVDITKKRMRSRKRNELLKKIRDVEHLETGLLRSQELLTNSLTLSILSEAFIQVLISRTKEVFGLIKQFIADVTAEADAADKIIKHCESGADEVDSTEVLAPSCENGTQLQFYKDLLANLYKEYNFNSQWWKDLSRAVGHFRSGPTLRFRLAPDEYILLVADCRDQQKIVNNLQRRAAAELSEIKKYAGSADREEKLIWVNFLTHSRRLTTRYNESLYHTKYQESMFNHTNV